MATIRKRKNGSFEIKVSCGYDVNGRQVNQYRSYYPEPGMTKKQIEKEVNRQAVLFEEDCKRGQITAAVKFQTLCEQWFDEYAKLELRPTTYERMRKLTARVYPAIGHLKLDKISRRDIKLFINDLAFNGRNFKTGEPLSRKTAIHHLNLIKVQASLQNADRNNEPAEKIQRRTKSRSSKARFKVGGPRPPVYKMEW